MNALITSHRWLIALFLLAAFTFVKASADIPRSVIEERYQSLQKLVDDDVLVAGMPQEDLLALMERELEPVVDFAHIARKVMGKFARRASDEQFETFTEVFKKTLVSTYSKGLEQLDQLDAVEIENAVLDASGERAKVSTVVVLKNGERYQVSYSLFQRDGRWLIENIVAEGVNIGLVFKNQFAQYMQTYQRDIDQVIAHWGE